MTEIFKGFFARKLTQNDIGGRDSSVASSLRMTEIFKGFFAALRMT